MARERKFDLVQFADQSFFHIQKEPALPGMAVQTQCGDIGIATKVKTTVMPFLVDRYCGICEDCSVRWATELEIAATQMREKAKAGREPIPGLTHGGELTPEKKEKVL